MRRCALLVACLLALPVLAGDKNTPRPAAVQKIEKPTREQIKTNTEQAQAMGKKAAAIAPKMHLIETAHFYLYSGFDEKAEDKLFAETAEGMFKVLCKQFDIDPKEGVWAGKCPIYAFDTVEQFVKFCKLAGQENLIKAGGFCAYDNAGMVFMVLNKAAGKTQFYDLMVHEGTHAFLARYLTNGNLPAWVNEGLAEFMCSVIVKDSHANGLWKSATKQVINAKKDPSGVLKQVKLEAFDYGIAHSFVRFLIAKDAKTFGKFVVKLKEGTPEDDALKDLYKVDQTGFLRAWRGGVEKMLQ